MAKKWGLTIGGNFFGWSPAGNQNSAQAFIRNAGGSDDPSRNLSNVIFPQSFIQAKIDLQTWADAKAEAEIAGWPFRVTMQKMYEKTKLNAHVAACLERRMQLTLLRDFQIEDANGEPDKYWTEYFKRAWYKQLTLRLILEAEAHGYTLISIGGIKDGVPDLVTSVKRWNISPDRRHVSITEKSPSGWSWEDDPFKPWHIWVPTIQTNGINNCGYGYLYPVAALEILQRNNVQYNTDFIEMFAQPYRWLKTADLEGEEYETKKQAMANMGHNGALITGLQDELEFLNDGSRGNGYKAYNDFDHRMKSDISKLIGGHADFIDSTPKALGGNQNSGGGDITDDTTGNSQVQKAIAAIRMIDGDFATTITNELVIPKLRGLGINIPATHRIHFLNDTEERAIQGQEADKNQKIATLALSMAQGGLQMDEGYFTKETGIPCKRVQVMPDKNAINNPKDMASGKQPLKNNNMQRQQNPKKTSNTVTAKKNGNTK